jgi:hypothetical protein
MDRFKRWWSRCFKHKPRCFQLATGLPSSFFAGCNFLMILYLNCCHQEQSGIDSLVKCLKEIFETSQQTIVTAIINSIDEIPADEKLVLVGVHVQFECM